MSWTYSFKNSDSRLLEQYKIIHRGYGLRLRQKLLLHCFVAHCIIRLSFSWRQTADHPRTFHTDTLSLHGLSVDQKLEVRTEIWSGTPCRPAADQQFAIFSRCLPVTRGRTWLHAGGFVIPCMTEMDLPSLHLQRLSQRGWRDDISRFLIMWPWPWPDDLDIRTWPEIWRCTNEFSRLMLSKVRLHHRQTERQTDRQRDRGTKLTTAPHLHCVRTLWTDLTFRQNVSAD